MRVRKMLQQQQQQLQFMLPFMCSLVFLSYSLEKVLEGRYLELNIIFVILEKITPHIFTTYFKYAWTKENRTSR